MPVPAAAKVKDENESRRRALSDATAQSNAKVLTKSKLSESPQRATPDDSGVDKADGTASQPVKHAPTECACSKDNSHYPGIALDETYTGTLETINNLLFNSGFEKKFLIENQKSTGSWSLVPVGYCF